MKILYCKELFLPMYTTQIYFSLHHLFNGVEIVARGKCPSHGGKKAIKGQENNERSGRDEVKRLP